MVPVGQCRLVSDKNLDARLLRHDDGSQNYGNAEMIQIQCRWGRVGIEVTGEPIAQFHCHCDDCQAVHGAAYVPESAYPADAVRVVRGDPTTWKLKRNPRFTCRECGTRLFIDVLSVGVRGINGYLLPADQFRPTFHMQCQFAVLPIQDGLPHLKSRPARFGGSDELVNW